MENYKKNNRINEALNIRGLKQADLVEMTGLKKSSISSWIAQRWQPNVDAVGIMAKKLDVSEMWLAGYDCPMERPMEQKKMDKMAAIVNELRNDDRLFNIASQLPLLNDSQRVTIETLLTEFVKLNQSQADS